MMEIQGISTHDEFEDIMNEIKRVLVVGKIMTPKDEFVYYEDLKDDLHNSEYDVLPRRNLEEYWYKNDGKIHKISPKNIISYHLDLLSFIDLLKDSDFYFVTHGNKIEGLVHYSDLKKKHVRILFYILISTLELKMKEIYRGREDFVWKVLNENLKRDRLTQIENEIKRDKEENQQMPLLNYLYFSEFLSVLSKDEQFLKKVGYTQEGFDKDFSHLRGLRNWTAHPTKDEPDIGNVKEFLIEGKKEVMKLYRLLDKLESLKINQIHRHHIS